MFEDIFRLGVWNKRFSRWKCQKKKQILRRVPLFYTGISKNFSLVCQNMFTRSFWVTIRNGAAHYDLSRIAWYYWAVFSPGFLIFSCLPLPHPIIHHVRPSPPPPKKFWENIVFNFELPHTDSSLGLWDIKLQLVPGSIILTVLWYRGEMKNKGYIKFGSKQGVL